MWRRVRGCGSDAGEKRRRRSVWAGKTEMEKGRIREVEWKGKMVENGWFWEKKEKPL